ATCPGGCGEQAARASGLLTRLRRKAAVRKSRIAACGRLFSLRNAAARGRVSGFWIRRGFPVGLRAPAAGGGSVGATRQTKSTGRFARCFGIDGGLFVDD